MCRLIVGACSFVVSLERHHDGAGKREFKAESTRLEGDGVVDDDTEVVDVLAVVAHPAIVAVA